MSSAINRRGLMLVLSSPSGAGKTTLARGLLETDGNINMSVSVTTRKPRPGETDGQDYHFVDTQAFGEMRNRGELLEHAKVFDNYYGTPRAPVMATTGGGLLGPEELEVLRRYFPTLTEAWLDSGPSGAANPTEPSTARWRWTAAEVGLLPYRDGAWLAWSRPALLAGGEEECGRGGNGEESGKGVCLC